MSIRWHLWSHLSSDNERFIYVGNDIKLQFKLWELLCCVKRLNFISIWLRHIKLFIKLNFISNLDKLSHSCSIKNNKVSVSCDSNVASYALFYGYLSVPIANNFGWYKT